MIEYKITEELLQQTINYLATQPYKDVSRFIQSFMQLEKIENTEKKFEVVK